MFNYIEPYITADKVLTALSTKEARMSVGDLQNHLKDDINYVPNNLMVAITQMDKDGYVVNENELYQWIARTGAGALLYANGGYKEKFNRDRISEEIKHQIDNSVLDTNQSVKDTNDALQKNIKRNDILFWLTLTVALVSAMATVKSCQIADEQTKLSKLKDRKDQLLQSLQNKLSQTENALLRDSFLIDSLKNQVSNTSKTYSRSKK